MNYILVVKSTYFYFLNFLFIYFEGEKMRRGGAEREEKENLKQ